MTNHFHLLLEVPSPPSDGEFGISEEELIHRLDGLYSRAYVAGVQAEILEARTIAEGKREHFSWLSKADQKKEMAFGRAQLAAIFERYTKRMHKPERVHAGAFAALHPVVLTRDTECAGPFGRTAFTVSSCRAS